METEVVVEQGSQSKELSMLQKVLGVFTSPAEAFAGIVAKPSWLVPILLISAVNLLFVVTAMDVILNETLSTQEQVMLEKGLDQEQVDQAQATTERFIKYFSPLTAVVFPIVIILVIAALFRFVCNMKYAGEATYKQVFSVAAFSWMIYSLGQLLMLPIVLARESLLVTFSAAAVLPDDAKTTFLYQLLAKVDVFGIWWIAVFAIGLAVAYKVDSRKTTITVAIVYVVFALVAASLTTMFS